MTQHDLTTRHEPRLNGSSTRLPYTWAPSLGDWIEGELVELRERSLGSKGKFTVAIIRAETGSSSGEPVTPGHWFELDCRPSVLRHWLERDEPKPGETVCVEFFGKRRGQLDFGAETRRVRETAGWE
jgi:hypothetical protein